MSKLKKIERNRDRINIDADDVELIVRLCADDTGVVELATGSNSLAEKPGKNNWIEHTSDTGLPLYIARIAKALIRSGKSKSQAISIAISRIKVWSAGGDGVTKETQMKAAEALRAWEKLKADNKARKSKK